VSLILTFSLQWGVLFFTFLVATMKEGGNIRRVAEIMEVAASAPDLTKLVNQGSE